MAAHNAYLREHRPPPKKWKHPPKQRLMADVGVVAYAGKLGLPFLRKISQHERRWLAQEEAVRALIAALDAKILALPNGEYAALVQLSAERRAHLQQLIEIDTLRIARFKARKRRRKGRLDRRKAPQAAF